MTTAQNIESIHVNGPEGLLTVIPAMVGFHPVESAVIVGFHGGTTEGVPVARVDLSDLREYACDYGAQMAQVFGKYADTVVVVVYTDEQPNDPTAKAIAILETALGAVKVLVKDTVFVGNAPAPVNPQAQAIAALDGRTIATSRDEMPSWVEHDDNSPDDASELLDIVSTIQGRDQFIAEVVDNAEADLPDLLRCCRAVKDDDEGAANLLAVTAICAYRTGNGSLANVALDRAMRIDPHHRLSHLLLNAIRVGISPSELADLTGTAQSPKG